jgi:predicted XRE-type DNA-binding protein
MSEEIAMDARKLRKLKAMGGRIITVQKFLDLSDQDMAVIEIRVALAKALQQRRKHAKLTQAQLAKAIQSSQSRVAKMEGGDPQASLESLVRALRATGTTVQLALSPQVPKAAAKRTRRGSASGDRLSA